MIALIGASSWPGAGGSRVPRPGCAGPRDGGGLLLGATLFLLMPFGAGFGLAVVLALFHHDFPGEQRARELTKQLADSDLESRAGPPTATAAPVSGHAVCT